ncbi:hypothetical protein EKO04_011631 [Ascochyta lentis]|uniref:Uncharacterized protein n=1 Tax=Ascochyta lentis TaxID=205686 RepID=A0A8H7MD68_9PLEO|nr:hypothetical protein EKO04_011631 [Ascochyta lentis]
MTIIEQIEVLVSRLSYVIQARGEATAFTVVQMPEDTLAKHFASLHIDNGCLKVENQILLNTLFCQQQAQTAGVNQIRTEEQQARSANTYDVPDLKADFDPVLNINARPQRTTTTLV